MRVAILASANLDLLPPHLNEALNSLGLSAEVHVSPFGQYRQEVLHEDSSLWSFGPTHIFLALDFEDLFSKLVRSPFHSREEQRLAVVEAAASEMEQLVGQLQDRLRTATIVLQSVVSPSRNALRLLEGNSPYSLRTVAKTFNEALGALAAQRKRVYLVDYEALVSWHGEREWFDERMWYIARMRLSRTAIRALAHEYAVLLRATVAVPRKCLILDLDGTLWGGVAGEEGTGIVLGHDGAGSAYREFQEELLNLRERGVLLAVNSKNNWDDAMEVIDQHPAMVLRREHFSALRINWEDKAKNIREIAEELQLGLDSMVFMDNNRIECEWVASQLPELQVVALPDDPALYRSTLLGLDAFAILNITDEDRERGRLYQQRALTEAIRRTAPTLEDFYAELDMTARFSNAGPLTMMRIAQLVAKTNQFNLTTRRYDEAEVAAMAADDSCRVYAMTVSDRSGDQGLVGVAILKRRSADWWIDLLLMSCRVMGRTLESAFLAFLADRAREFSGHYLVGEYLPTSKNAPVRDLYAVHGFEPIDGDGQLWRMDLAKGWPRTPAYIRVIFHPVGSGVA